MDTISNKIKKRRVIILFIILIAVAFLFVLIATNIFGYLKDKDGKSIDIAYPDWPVIEVGKNISVLVVNQETGDILLKNLSELDYQLKNGDNLRVEIFGKLLNASKILADEQETISVLVSDEAINLKNKNFSITCGEGSFQQRKDFSINNPEFTINYDCQINASNNNYSSHPLAQIAFGQTTVTYNDGVRDIKYYGGMGSNHAIINYNEEEDSTIGFDGDNFDWNNLDCLNFGKKCFSLTKSDSIYSLMTSKSYAGSFPILELPLLIYPSGILIGDTYNVDEDNFSYLGRNLQQDSGSVDTCSGAGCASWIVSGSEINSDVQAYYDPNSGFISQFQNNQKNESEEISTVKLRDSSHWYLEAGSVENFDSGNLGIYPDGKSWVIDRDLELDYPLSRLTHYYHGLGTIFVNGDLTIKEDVLPDNQSEDFLGFVVTGNVAIENGADIDAAIVCGGTLTTSGASRAQLTGSFVAESFDFNTVGTIIKYRIGLENHWPPGFRYINMPVPKKSY